MILRFITLLFSFYIINPAHAQPPVCKNYSDIKAHRNQKATIVGKFQKYDTPNKEKDVHTYWGWGIVLEDGREIAVKYNLKSKDEIAKFVNLPVKIDGFIYYGILVGSAEQPWAESATGYRIDAKLISSL